LNNLLFLLIFLSENNLTLVTVNLILHLHSQVPLIYIAATDAFTLFFGHKNSKWPILKLKQDAQVMLTNPHDTFRGQSRSPNMVPFHKLGLVSY